MITIVVNTFCTYSLVPRLNSTTRRQPITCYVRKGDATVSLCRTDVSVISDLKIGGGNSPPCSALLKPRTEEAL